MKSPSERLRDALVMVQEFWTVALAPLPTPSTGKAPGPAGSRPPLPTSSLSARAEVFEFLASWRRHTTDWFDDNPTTWEVPALAAWFLTHAEELVADEVILDELQGLEVLAKELNDAANPPVPAGPALGECPTCHETVRWDPLRLLGVCQGCATARPWSEWKGVLGVSFEGSSPVPAQLVVAFVAATYGRVITSDQLWQWASRADGTNGRRPTGVRRHGKNARGQTLYSLQEVKVWCDKLWGAAA